MECVCDRFGLVEDVYDSCVVPIKASSCRRLHKCAWPEYVAASGPRPPVPGATRGGATSSRARMARPHEESTPAPGAAPGGAAAARDRMARSRQGHIRVRPREAGLPALGAAHAAAAAAFEGHAAVSVAAGGWAKCRSCRAFSCVAANQGAPATLSCKVFDAMLQ
jgi:hypothetical protein